MTNFGPIVSMLVLLAGAHFAFAGLFDRLQEQSAEQPRTTVTVVPERTSAVSAAEAATWPVPRSRKSRGSGPVAFESALGQVEQLQRERVARFARSPEAPVKWRQPSKWTRPPNRIPFYVIEPRP